MGALVCEVGGVLLMLLGFVAQNAMIIVAGSILLGSAVIANAISAKL